MAEASSAPFDGALVRHQALSRDALSALQLSEGVGPNTFPLSDFRAWNGKGSWRGKRSLGFAEEPIVHTLISPLYVVRLREVSDDDLTFFGDHVVQPSRSLAVTTRLVACGHDAPQRRGEGRPALNLNLQDGEWLVLDGEEV